jgi:adenylate kinase
MILLIMGPQGSGKGTQARKIAQEFGLYYFDAGAHLRKIAKKDARINEIVNKRGALLPDEEIFKIVTDFLESEKIYDNVILDGYPRSVEQYNLVSNWFNDKGKEITKAIFLSVSQDISVSRLSARRMDPNTGKIYNLITKKPGSEIDVSTLVHREDDKPEAILERLKHYHKTTEPLVNLLKAEGKLIEVNGEAGIDEIHDEIKAQVESINHE